MASTQTLTELPVIQKTGMDYSTVISQIKEIIESNSNWASNWTQFYNSEAGTLLIQLMAWICDNLAVRQDLLYNENYLATATSDEAKRRLLKQIGYSLRSRKATVLPISIEFDNITTNKINLSSVRDNSSDFSEIKSSIFKFYAEDINGKSIPFEILKLDEDGCPDYTYSVILNSGSIYYTKDINDNQLVALQGNTTYQEFYSDTSDGPIFELGSDVDTDSIKVYLEDNSICQRVENFLDTDVVQGNLICYLVEMNENGKYQIRFPSKDLVTYNNETLSDRLYPAGKTIKVFYRVCEGADANISASYISVDETVYDENNNGLKATIVNVSSGYNGEDAEVLDSAVKNAPLVLTALNRAVTSEDYNRILKRNKLVLNCKSFTPDNMPNSFKKYYGKTIEPHEIFSFLILNKEINNIPSSKLNYYPWIETIKNHVLNEKYVFGNASLNNLLTSNDEYENYYIKDLYEVNKQANLDSKYDNGQNYSLSYSFEKDGKEYNARMLRNAIVYDTSGIFSDAIVAEKASKQYNLKVKLHSVQSDELYLKDIDGLDGSKELLTVKNNIIKNEVGASYTALNPKSCIDCKKYKYIKFVLDDIFTITVDLHKEAQNLYDKFKSIKPNWEEGKDPIEYYDRYYLYVDNAPATDDDYEYASQQENKYGGKTTEYYNSLYNYHNSTTYAGYRKGIIQLIRDSLQNIVDYTTEIDYENPGRILNDYKNELGDKYNETTLCEKIVAEGEKVQTINDKTFIYKISKGEETEHVAIIFVQKEVIDSLGVVKPITTEAKVLQLEKNENYIGLDEEINATEDIPITKQKIMYNSMFANGSSCFGDLNLQLEEEDSRRFLYQNYETITDSMKTYYTPEQKKDFYRIKVGDRILAVRLDAYSIINAYNYYRRLSLNNDASAAANGNFTPHIYDYFPYIGKGDMLYGLKDSEIIRYPDETQYDYKYRIETIDYDKDVAATLDKVYDSAFSKVLLGENPESAGIEPEDSIKYDTTKQSSNESDNISSVAFTLKTLVNTLEYIFSPVNIDKETIYELKDGRWYDLKTNDKDEIKDYYNIETEPTDDQIISYRNILDGALRVRSVKKGNFATNNIVDIKNGQKTNVYKNGYEYDLRFELFNKGETMISSVSEIEISSSADLNLIPLNGKEPEDLFEALTGQRRQIELKTSNYVDNIENCVSCYYNGDSSGASNECTLTINSQAVGERSSLYFIKTSKYNTTEIMYEFGLKNNFPYSYTETTKLYHNISKSKKAYGNRVIELYIGDDSEDTEFVTYENGAPKEDVNELTGYVNDAEKNSIDIGSIIYTSSDINYADAEASYVSYVLDDASILKIDKQDNFFFSSNEKSNEYAKPPIIGIEGESVYYDSDKSVYYINEEKSDFGVKLTKEKVDTNSYYDIEEDTYNELNVVRNKNVNFISNLIEGYDITPGGSENCNHIMNGIDKNRYPEDKIIAASKIQIPLIFSVDKTTNNCPAENEEFDYSKNMNNVLAVNPDYVYNTTGYNIYKSIFVRAKASTNEYINKNCYSFAFPYHNTTNKIVFSGLDYTDDGNITFYYPDENAFLSGVEDLNIQGYNRGMSEGQIYLAVKLFYRLLLGTNKTNPELYKLYPKEEMVKVNSDLIVCNFNEESDEYFYCPSKGHHLKFIYRTFVDNEKNTSKYGDYYIKAENLYSGFNGGYNFFIKKTEHSEFPDRDFYLHFINDRTYEPERNTEEDVLKNYMKKYQIIGTELNLLKPYFKTFDIVGTIRYNANYDVSTIKYNVEKVLDAYRLKSVKDIEIGNNVYRSDIFKNILSVEGVETFDLEYFGYDSTQKSIYPDKKYSLNISSDSDSKAAAEFYIVSILANTSGKHGAVISYEKSGVSID